MIEYIVSLIVFFLLGFVTGWVVIDGVVVKKCNKLIEENKGLKLAIETFSKLLNDGKVAARKEIEPLLVVWGKNYSIVANDKWEWEVRRTESVVPVEKAIEIDLRKI